MNKQSEIQRKYDSSNTRRFGLKLNLQTDKEVIEKLEAVPSIQGYIKDLIKRDLKSSK
jgi:hypothetical protein